MKIILFTGLLAFVLLSTGTSQILHQDPVDTIVEKTESNFLYIGFDKSTTVSERMTILNKTIAGTIEELDLMDYPIYRISVNNSTSEDSNLANLTKKLESEPSIMFVTNDQNLDQQEVQKIDIKRQGDVGFSNGVKELSGDSRQHYRQIILNHMPGLNRCVEKYYQGSRRKMIKALYEIVIDKKGSVKHVRLLESNIAKPQIRKCLKTKISNWRDFPRRRESEDLKLKFKFNY